MIPTHIFNALQEGKSILIFGAIHGEETCGAIAIQNIIKRIESGSLVLQSGRVTFVPVCNPRAYEEGRIYIDKNLNRIFTKHESPSCYEEKLANILTEYVDNHDYFLDIHSFKAKGDAFIFQDYLDDKTTDFANALGVSDIISGWPDIYGSDDVFNDGDTILYAHKSGVTGVLVECGQNSSLNSLEVAENVILRSLEFLGIIKPTFVNDKECDNENELTKNINNSLTVMAKKLFYKKSEGEFSQNWNNLNFIPCDTLIAHYSNGEKIVASQDCYILLPKYQAKIDEEWFYLGVKSI